MLSKNELVGQGKKEELTFIYLLKKIYYEFIEVTDIPKEREDIVARFEYSFWSRNQAYTYGSVFLLMVFFGAFRLIQNSSSGWDFIFQFGKGSLGWAFLLSMYVLGLWSSRTNFIFFQPVIITEDAIEADLLSDKNASSTWPKRNPSKTSWSKIDKLEFFPGLRGILMTPNHLLKLLCGIKGIFKIFQTAIKIVELGCWLAMIELSSIRILKVIQSFYLFSNPKFRLTAKKLKHGKGESLSPLLQKEVFLIYPTKPNTNMMERVYSK